MTREVVVGYHGHCFDGMCSAAVLTHVLRELEDGPLVMSYRGLDHQPGGSHVPEQWLRGEINAVVDFRYTTSPRLTWWFDHHVSGLGGEAERAHFERDTSGKKFFDPDYGSCCKLIADVATRRFGIDLSSMAAMIEWADVIDAARFPSAQMAVALEQPALQLMTVIEAHGDDAFMSARIPRLAAGETIDALVAEPSVQELFSPLLVEHRARIDAIADAASCVRGVVTFDLAGQGGDRYNKFIPYALHPQSRYCVAVTSSDERAKVSVGSNPWAPVPRSHHIARICERYGGGGHAVVGAVSLPPDELDRARGIAVEIAAELQSG